MTRINSSAQPVIIISTGRTGTNFLSKLFNEFYSDCVDAYHERGASRPMQILTNFYFSRLLPKSFLRRAWDVLKGWEVAECRKDFHIDSNCFLYGFVPTFPDLYPNLKVIHIVRDPRTYVASHLNYAREDAGSFIANYLVPFWQPSPFLTREMPLTKIGKLSRMERYAWIWRFKNQHMASLENSSALYLRIKFEDLFHSSNPETAMDAILDFIGLPHISGMSDRFQRAENQASRKKFTEWQNWNQQQCAVLDAICGEHMQHYGYGMESEWMQQRKQKSDISQPA